MPPETPVPRRLFKPNLSTSHWCCLVKVTLSQLFLAMVLVSKRLEELRSLAAKSPCQLGQDETFTSGLHRGTLGPWPFWNQHGQLCSARSDAGNVVWLPSHCNPGTIPAFSVCVSVPYTFLWCGRQKVSSAVWLVSDSGLRQIHLSGDYVFCCGLSGDVFR